MKLTIDEFTNQLESLTRTAMSSNLPIQNIVGVLQVNIIKLSYSHIETIKYMNNMIRTNDKERLDDIKELVKELKEAVKNGNENNG